MLAPYNDHCMKTKRKDCYCTLHISNTHAHPSLLTASRIPPFPPPPPPRLGGVHKCGHHSAGCAGAADGHRGHHPVLPLPRQVPPPGQGRAHLLPAALQLLAQARPPVTAVLLVICGGHLQQRAAHHRLHPQGGHLLPGEAAGAHPPCGHTLTPITPSLWAHPLTSHPHFIHTLTPITPSLWAHPHYYHAHPHCGHTLTLITSLAPHTLTVGTPSHTHVHLHVHVCSCTCICTPSLLNSLLPSYLPHCVPGLGGHSVYAPSLSPREGHRVHSYHSPPVPIPPPLLPPLPSPLSPPPPSPLSPGR